MTILQWWLLLGILTAIIDLYVYKYWLKDYTPLEMLCIFIYVIICFPIFIVELIIIKWLIHSRKL